MKKVLLLSLLLGFGIVILAQTNFAVKEQYKKTVKAKITEQMVGFELLKTTPITGAQFVPPAATQNRDLTIISIGQSANAYGYGYAGGQKTILWADENLDVFINIHRETASTYSGNLAIDISYDGGLTFENNIRLYESNVSGGTYNIDAARYPQGAIYNPPGNTDPESAYYAYFAPVLDGTNSNDGGWGGYGFGTANLINHGDTTKHLRSSRPGEGIWQYIPDGFTVTPLGTALVTDLNQDWTSGSLVYKDEILMNVGTWDDDENDFEYEEFLIDCETTVDMVRPSNDRVAFGPDGLTGWMVVLNDDGSVPFSEGSIYPQLYQTTDGGESWEDPIYVELGGPDGIEAIVYDWLTDDEIEAFFEPPAPDRDEILYTTAFDFDIVVDIYDNPHIAVVIGIGSGEYSIYTPANYIAAFDIFSPDGGETWDALECGRLITFRGTFGDLTEDNRINASSTMDGSKVFISWLDTDFEGMEDNNQPDIFCTGYDVVNQMMTPTYNVTEFTDGWLQAYFFVAPQYIFSDEDGYTIPFTYEDMDPNDPAAAVTFMYIQDFLLEDDDFDIFVGTLAANAGPDAAICAGSDYQLDGVAYEYTSVEWTTSGDGTFSDASTLDAVYTPGTEDISDGGATLTLTAYDEERDSASDDMELTIQPVPIGIAGEDAEICEGDLYTIEDADALNYFALNWTTSGDGTYENGSSLSPTYTPGPEDITNGLVTLTLNVTGYFPCGVAEDSKELTIISLPDVPGTPTGPDFVDSYGTPTTDYMTTGAANADSYLWDLMPEDAGTIEGDGTTGTVTWVVGWEGTASVSVAGVNDCGVGIFSEAIEVTVVYGVGIEEYEALKVQILPNPNNGEFILKMETESHGYLEIQVLDAIGNTVYTGMIELTSNKMNKRISLNHLKKGIYFIHFSNDEISHSQKLIIRK